MEWVRGDSIGRGAFGSVNLAIPGSAGGENLPLMAVKSCGSSNSASLRHEKDVLTLLGADCPQIIRCFGDCSSRENGEDLYNVLMEYATGGNLAVRVRDSGGGLPEFEIRRYTRSILRGLLHIHSKGFVHCDVKLQNILLCSSNDDVKIADFGLSKRAGEKRGGFEIRGTPLYMSPESVNSGEYESPADVWALGCAVAEMATGEPAWRCSPGFDVTRLLFRIGGGTESPGIPGELSGEGRDFLEQCFVRDPKKRWTAAMLLNHPFVHGGGGSGGGDGASTSVPFEEVKEEPPTSSPRGPFDFPGSIARDLNRDSLCSSIQPPSLPDSAAWCGGEWGPFDTPTERIQQLVTDKKPDWSFTRSWVTVR